MHFHLKIVLNEFTKPNLGLDLEFIENKGRFTDTVETRILILTQCPNGPIYLRIF